MKIEINLNRYKIKFKQLDRRLKIVFIMRLLLKNYNMIFLNYMFSGLIEIILEVFLILFLTWSITRIFLTSKSIVLKKNIKFFFYVHKP